eukprot:m.150288 g.150288  ORF g.150288 m.150288 type:complete len:546 (-) comp23294_c0_seq1:332-1969(-)
MDVSAAEAIAEEVEALQALFTRQDLDHSLPNTLSYPLPSPDVPSVHPRIRLRARLHGLGGSGDAHCAGGSVGVWVVLDRPKLYPSSAIEVGINLGETAPNLTVLRALKRAVPTLVAAGVAAAEACALESEVAAYAVYLAVAQALSIALDGGGSSQTLDVALADSVDTVDAAGEVTAVPAEKRLSVSSVGIDFERECQSSNAMIGVSLRFLLRFAVENSIGGFRKWDKDEVSSAEVCQSHVRPKTESLHSAYTALGDPHVRVAERNLPTHFVSHCWGCPFASLANALFVHQLGDDVAWAALEETVDLDKLQTLVEKELPSTTENFYWIDIFSKNQHMVESDTTAAELAEMVRSIDGGAVLVMHPLESPRMLSRVWCLFEMWQILQIGHPVTGVPSFDGMLHMNRLIEKVRTVKSRKPVASPTPRNKKKGKGKGGTEKNALGTGKLNGFTGALGNAMDACRTLCTEAVTGIDIRTAQATVAADREMILALIEGSVGIDEMTQSCRRVARDCVSRCTAAALESWARHRDSPRWRAAAVAIRDEVNGGL